MDRDLEAAKTLLEKENLTCALVRGKQRFTSTHRGVKPLLQWLEAGADLRGFCAADKVIGKAAAYLYVLLGIREVWAGVISRASLEVFRAYGIPVFFATQVEAIRNRTNTGLCPMEQAVKDICRPEEAPVRIRQALAALK